METSVVAGVRIKKSDRVNGLSNTQIIQYSAENQCEGNTILAAVKLDGKKTFPCTFGFSEDCEQEELYCRMLAPYMTSFLEGFDVSVVTYGQKDSGKSYSIYGPGLNCLFNESDYGLCQRFIREIFYHLSKKPERTYQISISWIEISDEDEQIIDLLNNLGLVRCNTVKECFDWIQVGMSTRIISNHNIFTLILEQQWITADGLNQHKLSTLSFCDLASTDRRFVPNEMNQNISLPRNMSLQALEYHISSLIDPSHISNQSSEQYSQSTLPTLLKDSFGGRAQTVFLLCVSPLEEDNVETFFNLEFMCQVQLVVNFVFMNTFTDNNVPIDNLYPSSLTDTDFRNNNSDSITTGQKFAMEQWLKLLQNAEGLFNRLILSNNIEGLRQDEIQQIEEWLYLKAECDDCINLNELEEESAQQPRSLGPIEEIDECEEDNRLANSSDNDTDSEICQKMGDIDDVVGRLMTKFQAETDVLVEESYREFLKSHPQSALDSCGSLKMEKTIIADPNYTRQRRRSIQPGAELSDTDLAMLNSINRSTDNQQDESEVKALQLQSSLLENNLKKCQANIEALENQILDLEQTIKLKEKYIVQISKNSDTRAAAKNRFNKKKSKLEACYEKTKKQLAKAVTSSKNRMEIERLKAETTKLEQQLRDLISMQSIANESVKDVKATRQSLHESKVQLEALQKNLKRERKMRDNLLKESELELKKDGQQKYYSHHEKRNKIRSMNTKIQDLDILLKEKVKNLEQIKDDPNNSSLRHEIRNLRRTRDHLVEQRCCLDKKLKKEKSLSIVEERKLLECDEYIEAIDTAIELKNEQICGRKSVDTDESLQREKGEQLLISRLNRLSEDEMRVLLYKYFQKVIDLKDSSRNLEIQLIEMERKKEAWEWREKVLTNAIRQARLEGEKNIILLQRQHEAKVNLMLKHFANDTNASSSFSTMTDELPTNGELDIYNPRRHPVSTSSDSLELFRHLKPEAVTHFTKYRPLEKLKDGKREERESKNRFLAKFQVLTRYQGNDKKKLMQQEPNTIIPHQNLKQLNNTSSTLPNTTKVTRQKNKLIIQQDIFKSN